MHIQEIGLKQFMEHNPFTVVRNPFDRVVSWYFYHTKREALKGYSASFDDWVKKGMQHHWPNFPANVWRQLDWIT